MSFIHLLDDLQEVHYPHFRPVDTVLLVRQVKLTRFKS